MDLRLHGEMTFSMSLVHVDGWVQLIFGPVLLMIHD